MDQHLTDASSSGRILLKDFSQNNLVFQGSGFEPEKSAIYPFTIRHTQLANRIDEPEAQNKVRVRSFKIDENIMNDDIAKPAPKEVMIYAKDKGINSEQGVMDFISYNPWILEDHNEKILDALCSFNKQISEKKISSKDRLELDTFVDYLIFNRKKKVNGTEARDNLQKILELNDIKKSLNSPNNLSIDIAKLRITSCL